MIVLGLDFETTWTTPVNALVARPLEIGAALFDTDTGKYLKIYSTFLKHVDHPCSPQELVALTGITDDMRFEHGVSPHDGMVELNNLIRTSEAIVAHNGRDFDKIIYAQECERLTVPYVSRPWIDTKLDLPLPDTIKTTKLTYLAAEHGFANPFAHRAIFDVFTMIRVMSFYPFEEVLALSRLRDVKIMAEVSYANKDQASSRGFYWDKDNKRWLKAIKENKFQELKESLPFNIILLQGEI